MSRPIKFRVWNKQDKKFNRPDYFAISLDGTLIQHHICYNEELDDDKYVIQQFTGLTDQDGKEIYEGDILEHDNLRNKLYYEVFWNKRRGQWMTKHPSKDQGYSFSTYRVAGNIFENPNFTLCRVN